MKVNKYNYATQTGMYRHKIKLQRRTITTNEYGEQKETFVDYKSHWAMIKTTKGEEVTVAAQEGQEITKRFIVRYSKLLEDLIDHEETYFTVTHDNQVYDVKSAIDDNDLHETITIVAVRGVVE